VIETLPIIKHVDRIQNQGSQHAHRQSHPDRFPIECEISNLYSVNVLFVHLLHIQSIVDVSKQDIQAWVQKKYSEIDHHPYEEEIYGL
jgi:hypothetical protein